MVARSIRFKKRLLFATSVALAAAAAISAVGLIAWPVESPQAAATSRPASRRPATTGRAGGLDDYAVIYQRSLRKPLFDAPLPTTVIVEQPKPQLTIKLIGTAVEPGFTWALFKTKSGEEKLVAPGQSLEGAELIEVSQGSATVRFAGELVTLKVQKEAGTQ